jgi:hypothetical protein
MQAIARVNRVYKDKPAGLVVDYLGIAFGAVDVAMGAAAIVGGGATAIIGAALGDEWSATLGLATAGLGLSTMWDGAAGIDTAITGRAHPSGLEYIGGVILGAHGAEVGKFASNFHSFSGMRRGLMRMDRGVGSVSDMHDVAGGAKNASSESCTCN